MRALLDVNVLIALLDADHSLHGPALEWFGGHAGRGWASCPITQNGCLRIMSAAGYPNPLPVALIAQRLAEATRHSVHAFWPDEVSILDAASVDTSMMHSPKQLTDTYLLALATHRRGRLVTFDRGIALDAVRGATARNLVQI
ncbi:MAG: PIN domain-containing protein [Gammaproteobacteria bacterium]|nr:PIN domain-containing protein [Gammaproteobacteria bacterium]